MRTILTLLFAMVIAIVGSGGTGHAVARALENHKGAEIIFVAADQVIGNAQAVLLVDADEFRHGVTSISLNDWDFSEYMLTNERLNLSHPGLYGEKPKYPRALNTPINSIKYAEPSNRSYLRRCIRSRC